MRLISVCITISLLLLSSHVFAYKTTDETAVMLQLDNKWNGMTVGQTTNIQFAVHTNDADHLQLIYAIIRKPNNIAPAQYAKNNYQQFQTKNTKCKLSPLLKITNKTKPFDEWKFSFQCADSQRIGLVRYVDADSINFYMFDLSTEGYPFYKITEVNMTKNLTNLIKICYKPDKALPAKLDDLSNCYTI